MRAALPVLLVLALAAGVAWAAGEQIQRPSILSGGGQVEKSGVVLQVAIGQPVAGIVAKSDTKLCSGLICGDADPPAQPKETRIYMPLVIK